MTQIHILEKNIGIDKIIKTIFILIDYYFFTFERSYTDYIPTKFILLNSVFFYHVLFL